MKYLAITTMALILSSAMYSQNFSYVKEIELNTDAQLKFAEEDVLECCYYLVAARYNKNDEQRVLATSFVTRWVNVQFNVETLLDEKIKQVVKERDELNDLFWIYYALRYIENEGDIGKDELTEAALTGVIDFCENPVNKIRLTKDLKHLKQAMEDGELAAYLGD